MFIKMINSTINSEEYLERKYDAFLRYLRDKSEWGAMVVRQNLEVNF